MDQTTPAKRHSSRAKGQLTKDQDSQRGYGVRISAYI